MDISAIYILTTTVPYLKCHDFGEKFMVHLLRIRKSVFCKGLLIWIRAFLWAICKIPVNHTSYITIRGGRSLGVWLWVGLAVNSPERS